MNIKITDFGLRHFDPKFGGTKILDCTPEEFIQKLEKLLPHDYMNCYNMCARPDCRVIQGYAPFCKLLIVENFTNARVGSLPITLENYQYLRSGYSARRDTELPVFSRWLELPLGKPIANYLVLVLYSREQIDTEAMSDSAQGKRTFEKFDADWGIVAILGQSHSDEEPMKPETMIRNALGVNEGGSGVALNREDYLQSVEFWEKNATVK